MIGWLNVCVCAIVVTAKMHIFRLKAEEPSYFKGFIYDHTN